METKLTNAQYHYEQFLTPNFARVAQ